MHRAELAQLSPETPRTAGGISPRKKAGCWRSSPRGGFEQIIYAVKDTPPEKIRDLAGAFGCDILGPPVAE
ncbi:MAG: hypothetical protein QOE41_4863 [Mycobacterium sp.]|nr:hypothetical protein [Mycobacterium sp.]